MLSRKIAHLTQFVCYQYNRDKLENAIIYDVRTIEITLCRTSQQVK